MIHIFNTKDELSKAMVESILDDLRAAVAQFGSANLLLSGGSTPGPIYKALNEECDFASKVNIGLVDERFVPLSSEFSNEKLLRSCFSNDGFKIQGMVHDSTNEIENIKLANDAYQNFIDNTDVVILGMGLDGHIASIFPNDSESDVAKSSSKKEILSTKAPSEPKHRITCSLEMIAHAKSIYLLFFGSEKWNVFHDDSASLPVHEVLKKREDVKLFYLDYD